MDKVCATAAIWARKGISQRLAINVGMRELSQPDFFFRLRGAMQRHGVSGTQLELEITETMAMELDDKVLMQIRTLRQEIGRAHVCTPVTTAHLLCRILPEITNQT